MKKKYSKFKSRSGKAAVPLAMGIAGAVVGGMFGHPTIGFAIGMSLGYMLFPADNNTEMPQLSTYPVQRSDKGTPIPIIKGTRKVAGNIVWLGEMQPYTVKTGGGGGKGGGGGTSSKETRYRRSFLISICHGPAYVLRAWAGRDEIDISVMTVFIGADNGTDIPTAIGETHGAYRYICCAYFENYDLGTSTSLPNFTFEVSNSPVPVYVGRYAITNGYQTVSKYRADTDIDTDWAINGSWQSDSDFPGQRCLGKTSDGIIVGHQATTDYNLSIYAQLFDNAIGVVSAGDTITLGGVSATIIAVSYMTATKGLIYYNNLTGGTFVDNNVASNGSGGSITFFNNGYNSARLTKLDLDGNVNTSWGDNGHMPTIYPPISITADSNDNIYVGLDSPSSYSSIMSFDSSGVMRWNRGWETVNRYYANDYYDIVLTDDESSIICGTSGALIAPLNGANVHAILAATGETNTSFGVNGYYTIGTTGINVYAIKKDNQDRYYCHFSMLVVGSVRYSILRLDSSGVLDTSFGTGGYAGLNQQPITNDKFTWGNTIDLVGNILYTISHPWTTGSGFDRTIEYVNWYDESGNENRVKTISGLGNEPAYCISGGGGYFYLGGKAVDVDGEGIATVHWYASDGTFLGQYIDITPVTPVSNILKSNDGTDSNPVDIINDLLTNARYGAGIDESTYIDTTSFSLISSYCDAKELLFSFVFDKRKAVMDHIDYVLSHFQGYIFMSEGKINIGVYKEEASTFSINRNNLVVEDE